MAIIANIDIETMWVFDVPAGPSIAEFSDEMGNPVTISEFDTFTAELFSPDDESLGFFETELVGETLEITWPEETLLTIQGVYTISFSFTAVNAVRTSEPWQFVVQERDGWLSLEAARAKWPDAPIVDVILYQLLQTAREQCEAYAPPIGLLDQVPPRYREAQAMQSRALFMASISNQADAVGVDGFTVRTFPLDWNIKALLRPKRAIAGIY